MNAPNTTEPALRSAARERQVVFLLCILAAVRVFIYSAAFPFFNPVDEDFHFDLVVRYSHGTPPPSLGHFSPEAIPYMVYYGSLEYQSPPNGEFPAPPWIRPPDEARRYLAANMEMARQIINHEASQPPLYYAIAGCWWQLAKICRLPEAFRPYLIRFSNIPYVLLLVWLGYETARIFFPDRPLVRLGVPGLLAFLPQSVFYSIQNDVLSPLCFGMLFTCLARWLRGDPLTARLAAATGLAFAATFLTKMSNMPLLAVVAVVIVLQVRHQGGAGTLRSMLPAWASLASCALLPIALWLAWNKLTFGDFSATAAKVRMLGWTYKPFSEWWSHPIFSLTGFWTFWSNLLATFWQGELTWHGQKLVYPGLRIFYALLSLGFMGLAVAGLWSQSSALSQLQRRGLWLSLGCFGAGIAFLAFLSLIYDFHECVYPSREHPYFTSGRLILGMAIPFLLLCVYGLDQALSRIRNGWIKPLALVGLVLFLLIGECVTNWPVFSSAYNWFHL